MTWKLPLTSLSLIPYLSPITCPVSSTSEIYFESSYFCLFCHPLAPATTTYHSDSYCKHPLRYLQASLHALLQFILFGATTAILRKAKAPPCSHCTRESKGLAVASLVLLPFLQPHAVAHSQHSVWSPPTSRLSFWLSSPPRMFFSQLFSGLIHSHLWSLTYNITHVFRQTFLNNPTWRRPPTHR